MTALWRINLWVTLFFTLVAALGMLVLLRQASTDVQREMRAAQAMVDYLHVAASRDPASLHRGLAGNLRHIRITPLTNPELTPPTRHHCRSCRWKAGPVRHDAGTRTTCTDPTDSCWSWCQRHGSG